LEVELTGGPACGWERANRQQQRRKRRLSFHALKSVDDIEEKDYYSDQPMGPSASLRGRRVPAVVVMVVGLLIALGMCWLPAAQADECTDACDASVVMTDASVRPILFCGSDGITHNTTYEATDNNYCYFHCNVAAVHQGSCGCPNDCYADSGHGTCAGSKCECLHDIWGGEDCGYPGPKNSCSGHGKVVTTDESMALPNYCNCDDGYTGVDCSSEVFTLGNLPWGNVFVKSPYSSSETYNDSHPVFNISVMATIRIELEEEALLKLINPSTIYSSNDYASATVSFDNNNIHETFYDVGLKPKGATSRTDLKKSWNIKFNEFVKGQKLVDIKKLGIKAGGAGDDTFLRNFLVTDLSRAAGVPVQRSSYATVFINGVYEGLYIMQETIDEDFVQSRVEGDNGNGNMMKLCYDSYIRYEGDNQSWYENAQTTFPDGTSNTVFNSNSCLHINAFDAVGSPLYYYEQPFGDGNWSDFISFLRFVNVSDDSHFAAYISQWFDIEAFLKSIVVENFMIASDNYESGQNYYLYHQAPVNDTHTWLLIQYDFDENFNFDPVGVPTYPFSGVFDYYVLPTDNHLYNPLNSRLLTIPTVRDLYVDLYTKFLTSVFGEGQKGRETRQLPTARFEAMFSFIEPWVAKDKFWQISCGITMAQFEAATTFTMENLPLRYEAVMSELKSV
jgi:spore coat protein H